MAIDIGRYDRCPRCRVFDWQESHTCPPLWVCRLVEEERDGEDGGKVHATDAREAACKYAKDLNNAYGSADYVSRMDVVVTSPKGIVSTWQVEMEPVPSYYASELKPDA